MMSARPARQTARHECSAPWRGLEEDPVGWLSVRRVSARSSDVSVGGNVIRGNEARVEGEVGARLQEWLDLVAARIGRECLLQAESHRSGHEIHAQELGGSAVEPFDLAVHLGRRPSQSFASDEMAFILGGDACADLASCIARRQAWCVSAALDHRFPPRHAPVLQWRGRPWPLLAIDAWERIASPWWDSPGTARVDSEREPAVCTAVSANPQQISATSAGCRENGRAASIARLSGRLHARIQIGSGLWLFARFPDRIAPLPYAHGGHAVDECVPGLAELATSELATSQSAIAEGSIPDQPIPEQGTAGESVRTMRLLGSADPWCVRCERAFHEGLEVSILGAWG